MVCEGHSAGSRPIMRNHFQRVCVVFHQIWTRSKPAAFPKTIAETPFDAPLTLCRIDSLAHAPIFTLVCSFFCVSLYPSPTFFIRPPSGAAH